MTATYSKTFLICPWCEKESGCRVDHLCQGFESHSFGPWSCEGCGCKMTGSTSWTEKGHEITVERHGSIVPSFRPCLTLMKMPGTKTYFIIGGNRYVVENHERGRTPADHQRYLYEEHSCPSNWMKNVVAVIDEGDPDPHGFLAYVRHVDRGEPEDDEDYREIFPEAFE